MENIQLGLDTFGDVTHDGQGVPRAPVQAPTGPGAGPGRSGHDE